MSLPLKGFHCQSILDRAVPLENVLTEEGVGRGGGGGGESCEELSPNSLPGAPKPQLFLKSATVECILAKVKEMPFLEKPAHGAYHPDHARFPDERAASLSVSTTNDIS